MRSRQALSARAEEVKKQERAALVGEINEALNPAGIGVATASGGAGPAGRGIRMGFGGIAVSSLEPAAMAARLGAKMSAHRQIPVKINGTTVYACACDLTVRSPSGYELHVATALVAAGVIIP